MGTGSERVASYCVGDNEERKTERKRNIVNFVPTTTEPVSIQYNIITCAAPVPHQKFGFSSGKNGLERKPSQNSTYEKREEDFGP